MTDLAAAALALLNRLDHMTTESFAHGGEKVEREALRAALGLTDEVTDAPGPSPVDGAIWFVTIPANDLGRLDLSLERNGETVGEFCLVWYPVLGDHPRAGTVKLEAWADGFTALAASNVTALVASWPEDIARDQAFSDLITFGFSGRQTPPERTDA